MPFIYSIRRVLPAAALFATLASAQSCWYPDGKTVSSDVPCDSSQGDSSCCSAQSFCLAGGLCLTGGVVTRGSCTDKTWGSPACAGFCKDESKDGEIAITPCSSGVSTNSFVCGLNNDDCKDTSKLFTLPSDSQLILRPAQVHALVGPALASGMATAASGSAASSSGDGGFSVGDVVGAGVGVAIPLLIALGTTIWLLIREKRKNNAPRHSMYKNLDDDTNGSIMIRPAPSMLGRTSTRSSSHTKLSSKFGSQYGERDSYRNTRTTTSPRALYIPQGAEILKPPSVHSPVQSIAESQRASHIPSFAERIEGTRVTPQLVDVRESNTPSRHELDSNPSTPLQQTSRNGSVSAETRSGSISAEKQLYSPGEMERFELAASRMSR